jgi:diaminopimelate epimerase
MKLTFYKYHGTGNDFVMIDNSIANLELTQQQVAALCHRRFGIGADGLIFLQKHPTSDFEMLYYNSDGNTSTMCGNGGRCIVKFAADLNLINRETTFMAIDGLHRAKIDDNGLVNLQMNDTKKAEEKAGGWFINTGSPHHIQKVDNVDAVDVQHTGKTLRDAYGSAGANVNFVELAPDKLRVRTYERGVEAETYSCGTGVTAVALAAHQQGWANSQKVEVETPGGLLHVAFLETKNGYENIWLIGPAVFVFKGEIDI